MPTYKGRWRAVVEQEFEIEADDEREFRRLIDEEMDPRQVIELREFEHVIDEVIEDAPAN